MDSEKDLFQDELESLRREIENLEESIVFAKDRKKGYELLKPEDPSILNMLKKLCIFPIGVFIAAKILFMFLTGFNDVSVPLGFLNISATTFVAFYCATPVFFVTWFVAIVNKTDYLKSQKEIKILDELLECLTKELEKRRGLYDGLAKIKEDKEERLEAIHRLNKRKNRLDILVSFRKQVISHYKAGTLESYLEKIGISGVHLDECMQYAKKEFLMEQVKK